MYSLDLFKETVDALKDLYPLNEAREFAFIIIDHLFQTSKTQVLSNRKLSISPSEKALIEHYIHRLSDNEPIQYIIGETYFLGKKFLVNTYVLIPRGETEELVLTCQQKLQHYRDLQIIDLCTGSGCIAISMQLLLPEARVCGVDISAEALEVAQKNAQFHQSQIEWIKGDVLLETLLLPPADLIVSNPPYVLEIEKAKMDKNVLDYEPHLALFVPDADPLLFYRKIVDVAIHTLKPKGWLAFEINERYGKEVANLYTTETFHNIEILKDLHGKERFVMGQKK